MIRRQVGPLAPKDLAMVEPHRTDDIGVFLPMGGACGYAVEPMRLHPCGCSSSPGTTDAPFVGRKKPSARREEAFSHSPPGVSHTERSSEKPPDNRAIFVAPAFLERPLEAHERVRPLP
jgi:hypothetical protein